MALNVVAIVVLIIFYAVILVVGLVAAWKVKVKGHETGGLETALVAGRDLKGIIGIFTMIATTVGGGYINGTAESVARDGLVWTLAPLGIFIGLMIGGVVYAGKMREREYLTMLDPFQRHYGNIVTFLIYLASLAGDLLWTASILNALGTTLSVIADLQLLVAVLLSGSVTIVYTMVGSMISVAYTDVVQLLFIFVGLTVSLPFVFTNSKVHDLMSSKDTWLGQVSPDHWAVWLDLFIAMTLGTIPWQSYFQRVLSVRTVRNAQVLSFVGAFGALIMVIPSVLIGVAGASADWNGTTFGKSPIGTEYSSLILPLVINEFTTPVVSILGLGAISAAVMSSMDSAVLGTSSMFTHNIYRNMLRRQASGKELRIVQIVSVVFFGSISMAIALWSSVIYGVFTLAADIVFVIIFPQLTTILYWPNYCNPVGAICGFVIGLILRVGAGEEIIKMPVWIYFPFFNKEQLFPFRTFAMLVSFVTVLVVTFVSRSKVMRSACQRFEYSAVGQHEDVIPSVHPDIVAEKETRGAGDTAVWNIDHLKENQISRFDDVSKDIQREGYLEMDLMITGKFRKLNTHGDF